MSNMCSVCINYHMSNMYRLVEIIQAYNIYMLEPLADLLDQMKLVEKKLKKFRRLLTISRFLIRTKYQLLIQIMADILLII
jgi:hypothetical protein